MKRFKMNYLIAGAVITAALVGTLCGCSNSETSSTDTSSGASSKISSSVEASSKASSAKSVASKTSSTASSTSNKKESNNTATNKDYITKADFDKITNGMSHEKVKKIIGCDGELMSEVGTKGEKYYTVVYNWKGKDGISNAVLEFQDNKLISKSQVGLK